MTSHRTHTNYLMHLIVAGLLCLAAGVLTGCDQYTYTYRLDITYTDGSKESLTLTSTTEKRWYLKDGCITESLGENGAWPTPAIRCGVRTFNYTTKKQ